MIFKCVLRLNLFQFNGQQTCFKFFRAFTDIVISRRGNGRSGSQARCQLTGRMLLLFHCTKEKGPNPIVPAIDPYLCCLCQVKCLYMLSSGDYNHSFVDNSVHSSLALRLVDQQPMTFSLCGYSVRAAQRILKATTCSLRGYKSCVWLSGPRRSVEGTTSQACTAFPDTSYQRSTHRNKIVCSSWWEAYRLILDVLWGSSRLCSCASPILHRHRLDHVHVCRQGRC